MKDINDILAKHFSGETSPEEELMIADWKVANEDEYKLLSEAWNVVPEFSSHNYDEDKAWSKIEGNFKSEQTKVFQLKTVVKWAAAACAVLVVGLGFMWMFSGAGMIEVTNTTAQAKEVKLPDGTTVWLASNSSLEYASNFEENRSLNLNEGQAYFEVERDEKHPFVITTANGEVEVLGTAFNVSTLGDSTAVSVSHGLVALRNKVDEIQIAKGESASATNTEISEKTEVSKNFLGWKTGVFKFVDERLDKVAIELNQFYNNRIEIKGKAKSTRLTASFENLPLEEVIEIIVITCSVQSEVLEDKTILK